VKHKKTERDNKTTTESEEKNMADDKIMRGTGLLIIEARDSNPNGDPDRESDPRQRPDKRGEISPVSFKRKVRDLIQSDLESDQRGPVWDSIAKALKLKAAEFCILESRGRKRAEIVKEVADKKFVPKYWDARVFGCTFLEEKASHIRTGVVQFGMGMSVSPILIKRYTNTNKPGVEGDTDRGMAPLAYRVVEHGVYVMPFCVNATAAGKSGCAPQDLEVLFKAIPYSYPHNPSAMRPFVEIRHAWYMEHKSPLGSCSDFALIDAMKPSRKKEFDPEKPSKSWDEYKIPKAEEIPAELKNRIKPIRDLMDEVDGIASA
jgi:CRISPR-associated protein Csd2